MNTISRRSLLIGFSMLLAAGVAYALTPREKVADTAPKINLEEMIPKQFGDWQVETNVAPVVVNPQAKALIDKIYSETLSRTYFDKAGNRIMLSIAYGGDQSDSMQVHNPDVCYPAAGFQIRAQRQDVIDTPHGNVEVKRMLAVQGQRIEPVTYWIKVGDRIASSGMEKKINQLRYGLTGKIPDGLLFRVSSISPDEAAGYRTQDVFVQALLASLSQEQRVRLVGDQRL